MCRRQTLPFQTCQLNLRSPHYEEAEPMSRTSFAECGTMSSSIDERLSLYENCPSEESLREIIRALQELIDSEKTASNSNKLGYCLLH